MSSVPGEDMPDHLKVDDATEPAPEPAEVEDDLEHHKVNGATLSVAEAVEGETATTRVNIDVPPQDMPKDDLHDATFDNVVAKMTNVEQEMDSLRAYLETNDVDSKALLEWPSYTRYAELHSAVRTLIQAVENLDRHSNETAFPSDWTHHHLADAREISLSTSKATIFAMKVMSKKTGEYAKALEDPSPPPTVEDITNKVVACEIGKLLEHSTEATESVWAAVDLLQRLHNATIQDPLVAHDEIEREVDGKHKMKWSPRDWLTLCCVLCCLFLTTVQELRHPVLFTSHHGASHCTLATKVYTDLSHAYSLFHESYKHAASLQQSQHHKLIILNEQYHDLQSTLEDQDLRIDNTWEALGPPNANGTYYSAEGAETYKCDCADGVDGKLQELRQGLEQRVKRAEEKAGEVRRAMQLADIRLSKRMDKLEWKVR